MQKTPAVRASVHAPPLATGVVVYRAQPANDIENRLSVALHDREFEGKDDANEIRN